MQIGNITGISYCLRNVSCYQTQCSKSYFLGKWHIIALCNTVQQLQQKVLISLLLSYSPPKPSADPHWLQDLYSMNISCNQQDWKNKPLLAEVLQSS